MIGQGYEPLQYHYRTKARNASYPKKEINRLQSSYNPFCRSEKMPFLFIKKITPHTPCLLFLEEVKHRITGSSTNLQLPVRNKQAKKAGQAGLSVNAMPYNQIKNSVLPRTGTSEASLASFPMWQLIYVIRTYS